MLTSEQSLVKYERGRAFPDRLTRGKHAHYLDYAMRMLAAYRAGVGSMRRELHRAIGAILADEPNCPRQRIAAFCKLLDDQSDYDIDRRGRAAELRLKVFAAAAQFHPLVSQPDGIFERSETEAKRAVATQLGRPWEEIESSLYADVIDRQRLREFAAFDSPEALLSRYNLAQLQACLYRARQMIVIASADLAALVRHAKLARLMVESRRLADNRYRLDLSGPSSVLHDTRRYGVNFAHFMPTLVACREWQMQAFLTTSRGGTVQLQLSSADGYRSHQDAPAAFDSDLERRFAADWGDEQSGWRLSREAGILQQGQTTFVPDFLLKHADGREAYLEIVGFWTPQYLAAKRKTIAVFRGHRILLAIPSDVAKENPTWPGVVVYKKRIKVEEVVKAAEELTRRA